MKVTFSDSEDFSGWCSSLVIASVISYREPKEKSTNAKTNRVRVIWNWMEYVEMNEYGRLDSITDTQLNSPSSEPCTRKMFPHAWGTIIARNLLFTPSFFDFVCDERFACSLDMSTERWSTPYMPPDHLIYTDTVYTLYEYTSGNAMGFWTNKSITKTLNLVRAWLAAAAHRQRKSTQPKNEREKTLTRTQTLKWWVIITEERPTMNETADAQLTTQMLIIPADLHDRVWKI